MQIPLFRAALPFAAAALLAACDVGPQNRTTGDNEADPFNGVVDNKLGSPVFTGIPTVNTTPLAFNTKVGTDCPTGTGNSPCYRPQVGYVAGKTIQFWNVGAPTVGGSTPRVKLPFNAGTATAHRNDGGFGSHADSFPHSCEPKGYNPVTDAYTRDFQFPIIDSLPLTNSSVTSNVPPIGVVALYGVNGIGGAGCNDLKFSESIGDAGGDAGKFGSHRTATPVGIETWMIFDPTIPVFQNVNVSTSSANLASQESMFWYRGIMGGYLSGGRVPVDAQGNLVPMEGVILDQPGTSAFEVPGTDKAIILPYQPGEDGYSPWVLLHDFRMPTGKKLGDYTSVCQKGQTCPATGVPLASTTAAPFNSIFIVASAQ